MTDPRRAVEVLKVHVPPADNKQMKGTNQYPKQKEPEHDAHLSTNQPSIRQTEGGIPDGRLVPIDGARRLLIAAQAASPGEGPDGDGTGLRAGTRLDAGTFLAAVVRTARKASPDDGRCDGCINTACHISLIACANYDPAADTRPDHHYDDNPA